MKQILIGMDGVETRPVSREAAPARLLIITWPEDAKNPARVETGGVFPPPVGS
jgi:hypothetical protein